MKREESLLRVYAHLHYPTVHIQSMQMQRRLSWYSGVGVLGALKADGIGWEMNSPAPLHSSEVELLRPQLDTDDDPSESTQSRTFEIVSITIQLLVKESKKGWVLLNLRSSKNNPHLYHFFRTFSFHLFLPHPSTCTTTAVW